MGIEMFLDLNIMRKFEFARKESADDEQVYDLLDLLRKL
jgi:hypothetical protein